MRYRKTPETTTRLKRHPAILAHLAAGRRDSNQAIDWYGKRCCTSTPLQPLRKPVVATAKVLCTGSQYSVSVREAVAPRMAGGGIEPVIYFAGVPD